MSELHRVRGELASRTPSVWSWIDGGRAQDISKSSAFPAGEAGPASGWRSGANFLDSAPLLRRLLSVLTEPHLGK